MCELFAFSSREPAGLCCSLAEFDRHGGESAPHGDGWGLARYIDRDVLLFKEALPAAQSALAREVREQPLASRIMISHVRRATQGAHTFMNCQPFVRELGGAAHVFAHNGNLGVAALRAGLPAGGAQPVGDTDSEVAFCVLLGELRAAWLQGRPSLATRVGIVSAFAARMRELGPANFIYSDGDALFAHGHRRMQGAEGVRPPGLWALELGEGIARACGRLAGISIDAQSPQSPAVLFASVPLSDDTRWRALGEGEVVAVRDGAVNCTIG